MGCTTSVLAAPTVRPEQELTENNNTSVSSAADEALPSVLDVSFVDVNFGLRAADLALALIFSSSPGRVQHAYDFSTSAVLGKGSFATVRRAKSLRTGELVAVKTVKLGEPARNSIMTARRLTEEQEAEGGGGGATATIRVSSDTGAPDRSQRGGIRVTLTDECDIRAFLDKSVRSPSGVGDSLALASSPGGSVASAQEAARSDHERRSDDTVDTTRARKAGQVAPAPPPRHSLDSARRHLAAAAERAASSAAASAADWTISPKSRAAEQKSATELAMLCREIDVLCRFKNDCVVNLLEYFVSPSNRHIHLVLELLRGGALCDELAARHPAKGCFTEAEARTVARRLLKGLVFLHENGCVHRDIKLDNLLLKAPGNLDTVTIADFGFAKRLHEAQHGGPSMHTLLGTPRYTAPEVLEQAALHREAAVDGAPLQGRYDSALDLWSAGVILFKLLSGSMPFEANQEWELYQKIRRGHFSMEAPVWDGVSDGAKNVVKRLLSKNPAKRPTAAALLYQDPWINHTPRR